MFAARCGVHEIMPQCSVLHGNSENRLSQAPTFSCLPVPPCKIKVLFPSIGTITGICWLPATEMPNLLCLALHSVRRGQMMTLE